MSRRSTRPEHVRYLRQFVRLTGLGCPEFDDLLGKFQEVEEQLYLVEGVETLEPFNFGRYEGHASVDLHARYLTERRHVPGEPTIPFTPDVDPHQYLEEARGGKFVRVRDNVVQYLQRVQTGEGVK